MDKTTISINGKQKTISITKSIMESLNRENKKEGYMSNFEKVVAVAFFISGAIMLLSALPQQTPSVWDLKFIKINIGTNLDLIRIGLGLITLYIGKKIYDDA